RVSSNEDHRQTPGESHDHGEFAADWRHRDVAGGRAQREIGSGWAEHAQFPDSHVADGGDESGASDLDWSVSDSVGGLSGNVAVDVHDRGGTTRRNVSRVGAGIFFLLVDSDDGSRDMLRPPEVTTRKGRERDWRVAH